MEIKKDAKRHRDSLQQLIYKIINPLVKGMIKVGITPNMVSTMGFLGTLCAAVMFCLATLDLTAPCYALIGWGGLVMILSSLFDMLDGQVARTGGLTTTFGAMYDSVLDRYSELITLGALSYVLILYHFYIGALITFVALVGSIMVSYVRARAEGLGIECKIGFMQRPERVVVTSLAAMLCGIFGSLWIIVGAMAVIAVFANLTAFARLSHCRRALENK